MSANPTANNAASAFAAPTSSVAPVSSPFMMQPESLIPGAAPVQPQIQAPPTQSPFPTSSGNFTAQAPVSPSSESQGKPKFEKLVFKPEMLAEIEIVQLEKDKFIGVKGLGTFFFKTHLKAAGGTYLGRRGADFSAWIFPIDKYSEVKALVDKFKSGEIQPSSEEDLKKEKQEKREKRIQRLQTKESEQKQKKSTTPRCNRQPYGFPQGATVVYMQPPPQFGFQQPQQFGFQQPQQFGFQQAPQFGFPQQQPAQFGQQAPQFGQQPAQFGQQAAQFGQQAAQFGAPHFNFQQPTQKKTFIPSAGMMAEIKFDGNTHLAVVNGVSEQLGNPVATVQIQNGGAANLAPVNGKWQVQGFQTPHTVFFKKNV